MRTVQKSELTCTCVLKSSTFNSDESLSTLPNFQLQLSTMTLIFLSSWSSSSKHAGQSATGGNISTNIQLFIASCIGLVIYLKKKNALHFVARDWHSENYNLTWPRVTWMRDFTWPSQTEDQLCAQSDIKARIVVNPSSIYFLCFRKFKSNAWRGKWSNVWASFFRINFSFLSSSC